MCAGKQHAPMNSQRNKGGKTEMTVDEEADFIELLGGYHHLPKDMKMKKKDDRFRAWQHKVSSES